MTTLADLAYETDRLKERLEGIICSSLSTPFRWVCEIKRLDPYDRSIEFWSVPGVDLDPIDTECLWLLGFDRCWVCYQERGSENGEKPTGEEKYYYKRKASA